jgi:hypothetical protein
MMTHGFAWLEVRMSAAGIRDRLDQGLKAERMA